MIGGVELIGALGLAMHACITVGRWVDALRMWEQYPKYRTSLASLGLVVAEWWSTRHTPTADGAERVRTVWQNSLSAHVRGDEPVDQMRALAAIIHLHPTDADAVLAASFGFNIMDDVL